MRISPTEQKLDGRYGRARKQILLRYGVFVSGIRAVEWIWRLDAGGYGEPRTTAPGGLAARD